MTPLTLVHLGRYSDLVHTKTVFCPIFRVRVRVNLDNFIGRRGWQLIFGAEIHTHHHM
jgi:hypothetical protein